MVVRTTRARTVVLVVALALAASLLTLAVVLAKPVQAQADTSTDIYRDTFTFSQIINRCPPAEEVSVEGTVHQVSHSTTDANGVVHIFLQTKIQGQGVGLNSGDKYVYNDLINQYFEAEPRPFDQTYISIGKIIRQGSTTDDLTVRAVLHVTVNANGEVTTDFLRIEDTRC